MLRLFVLITGIIFFAGNISAQTTIEGGNVSGIWNQADSPYHVYDEITIPNDSTLIIESGVVVEFQGHYALQVKGRLLAVGTENDTILFTVKDTSGFSDPDTSLGGWYGIRFIDTPLTNDSSKIVYCKLQYGKAVADVWPLNTGGAICAIQFGKVLISNSTFSQNSAISGGGVYAYNSDLQIDSCLFIRNMTTEGDGGAINYIADSTIFDRPYHVELTNSSFIENEAIGICAGVYIEEINSEASLIDVIVDHCEFSQNHSDRVSPFRISGNISDFTLANSMFRGNTSTRWTAGPGFLSGCTGEVYNCIFASNYSYHTDSSSVASGSSLGREAQVDFINCTFTDTSDAGGSGVGVRAGAMATIMNSIIWGYGDNPISITTAQDLGATAYVNYCNIQNGIDSVHVSDSLSTLHWGIGNIAEEPQFVDIANGDLHLQNTSPSIGSGINCFILNDVLHCAPESDIEGNIRPAPEGSNADMGAYENNLGSPSVIGENIAELPVRFRLSQNHPNPFNPITVINYELPTTITVELSIYNLLGQKVAMLVSEKQQAGKYSIEWDASLLASGIYYYKLRAGEFQDVKKMVFLK